MSPKRNANKLANRSKIKTKNCIHMYTVIARTQFQGILSAWPVENMHAIATCIFFHSFHCVLTSNCLDKFGASQPPGYARCLDTPEGTCIYILAKGSKSNSRNECLKQTCGPNLLSAVRQTFCEHGQLKGWQIQKKMM